MHRNAERIQQLLGELGSKQKVVELSSGTRTAAEAAASLGVEPAQIAKSIIFTAAPGTENERPVLVIASGSRRICKKKIRRLLGCKVRQADADTVKRFTGFPIGGVPPIGHHTAPEVLIDESLEGMEVLWAAAGTPFAVFQTNFAELVRWTGGRPADVREVSSPS